LFNRGMSNADRHRLIAQTVKDSGSATVPELAGLTGASEMTIRRDLDTLAAPCSTAAALEAAGTIVKTA
jgi:DeoR family transcriptional regulator, fructose operon transcriptional repressor